MNDEEKQKIREHPCYKCGMVMMDFPHPRVRCAIGGHTALDIVGLLHCLDTLYESCPNNELREIPGMNY